MPEQFAYEIDGKVTPIPGTICGAWGEQTLSIVEAAGSRKQFSGNAYSGGPLRLKEYLVGASGTTNATPLHRLASNRLT